MLERVRKLNDVAHYVLYWARVNRRVESNHGLAYAAQLANQHGLPLLFYEELGCESNDRFHTFILEGVPETARRLAQLGIGYVFNLRKKRGDRNRADYRSGRGVFALISDDYPSLSGGEVDFAVDSSCIVPMAHFEKQEYAAYTIRPKIRKVLAQFLQPVPPIRMKKKWDLAVCEVRDIPKLVAECEIDHTVAPSAEFRGGRKEAERRLRYFLENNLRRYAKTSNQPSEKSTSGMSPYLHFGYISSLEIALAVKDEFWRN